jgi:hypothetical protein
MAKIHKLYQGVFREQKCLVCRLMHAYIISLPSIFKLYGTCVYKKNQLNRPAALNIQQYIIL